MIKSDTIKNLIEEKNQLLRRIQIIDNYLEDVLINGCDTEYIQPKKLNLSSDSKTRKVSKHGSGKIGEFLYNLAKKYGTLSEVSRVSNLSLARLSQLKNSELDKINMTEETIQAIKSSGLSEEEKNEFLKLVDVRVNKTKVQNIVSEIRTSKNMSQKEFAKALGMSENTLQIIESATDKIIVAPKTYNKFLKAEILTKDEKDKIFGLISLKAIVSEDKMSELGRKLEEIRKDISMTRDEFSEILNFERSTYLKMLWKKPSNSDLGRIMSSTLDKKYKQELLKIFPEKIKNKIYLKEEKKKESELPSDEKIESWIRGFYTIVTDKELNSFRNYIKNHKLYEVKDMDRNEIRLAKEALKNFVDFGEDKLISECYYNGVEEIFKQDGFTRDLKPFLKKCDNLKYYRTMQKCACFKNGIYALRNEQKFTQRDVANRIGTSPSRISNFEKGDKVPLELAYKFFSEFSWFENHGERPAYWILATKNQDKEMFYKLMKKIIEHFPNKDDNGRNI